MIVYEGTKEDFLNSVEQDSIAEEIESKIYQKMHKSTVRNEFRSWENSLEYMYKVLNDAEIPIDAGIAIEYNIPQTSKRVDFLISGYDLLKKGNVVIIELKQWDKIESVLGMDALVETYVGNAVRRVVHPSYQAWTYSVLIRDYNESVQSKDINLSPCSYLHNYRRQENDPLDEKQYEIYLEDAPAFTRGEVKKLRDFIKKLIHKGDQKKLLYEIENGRIRPSKSLQDSLVAMLKGNKEFIMIDEQKIVYEEIITISKQSQIDNQKRVIIVRGGPGTGKTVVAINLLVNLTEEEQFCQYVSKNSAPRNVYQKKLKGEIRKSSVDNMFKGSGIYTEAPLNSVDTILVDEAHRLNEKSGMFQNLGDNLIIEKNHNRNRSRILAGYCWKWIKQGKNDSSVHDIKINDFEMSWNLGNSSTFAIDESSVNQAGCIHTSQGLEFDYVGVIIGMDLRYENGKIVTDFTKRASSDQSLKGIKSMFKKDPIKAYAIADEIIKNTYRTLLTRGMRGCYVYCVDTKLAQYLKERI